MTISAQFLTMLAMIGMGSFFGAALDTYNRFLQRSKRKSWIVFCNDILFWTLQALFIFYVLYLVNKGELRFYIFIALICGFAAYQSLLKRGYMKVLESIIRMVVLLYRFLIKVIIHMVYRPIYALVMMILTVLLLLGRGIVGLARFLLRVLLFLLRVLLTPLQWIFKIIWNFIPKNVQKRFIKLYNKGAGFLRKFKNYLNNTLSLWKNKGK